MSRTRGRREVIEFLKPQLQSAAVESTFNWYWLVDGLHAADDPIDLANPVKIEQYSGMKHADDKPRCVFPGGVAALDAQGNGSRKHSSDFVQ
jgi:hypothetical protein